MPDNNLIYDRFINLIPSHIMKFIVWHEDAEYSDVDEAEQEQPHEDEGEEDEAVQEHFYINRNLVFNK